MAKKTNYTVNGNSYFRKYVTIHGKRKMVYADSEKAWNKKVEELKKLETLGIIDSKKSLGDAMQIWVYTILFSKQNLAKSTISIYEGIYRNTIKDDAIMGIPLLDVKTATIQDYANRQKALGKSANSVQQSVKVLKMFFKYAVEESYVMNNPCKRVSLAPSPKNDDIVVLSNKEIERLNNTLENERERLLVLLGLATGMRIGELLGLRHSDIDGKSEVTVMQQLQNVRHVEENKPIRYELAYVPTKSGDTRTIPLPLFIQTEYQIHKKLCQIEHLQNGKGRITGDTPLFLSPTGLLCQQGQINKRWQYILAKSEIEHKKFHTLRHTYITKLAQSTDPIIPIAVIMELAGHKDMRTTLRYTHVEMEHKEKTVDVISELFS